MAIHRDDVDMDVAEAIDKSFPGMKVVYAGDRAGSKEAQAVEALHRELDRRFFNGQCGYCQNRLPGDYAWNPDDKDWFDSWDGKSPAGWRIGESLGDGPFVWECPECDKDEEGVMYPMT